jgi:N-dimethylarginine dimethylaminohydrolase
MAVRPWFLLCPPDYYGIEYEINPWMSRSRNANHRRARQQWEALRKTLTELGAQVSLIDPAPGLPDMVFTANAGLVYQREVFLSRFRYPVRDPETVYFEAWFRGHGFSVHGLPEDYYFEGAGDALFCGDVLFAGYRIRSDVRSHQYVAERIGCEVLALELTDPRFYHLDTCFCPLRPGVAIWYPGAFDPYGAKVLRERVAELIEVEEAEALRFACNSVVVGRHVLTPAGCPGLHEALRQRGFVPLELELDEFLKAGGSAKCLTLRLDGEEAAAWKYDAEPGNGTFPD